MKYFKPSLRMYSKIIIGRFSDHYSSDAIMGSSVFINHVHVGNGVDVKKDQILCDIDIDKMTLSIYAQESGKIYKFENFKDNNEVSCTEPLYIIEE